MHRLQVALIVSVALLCAPTAALATYLPQERIPTDSPVYRDLERLATSYGVQPKFLSSRPLRRAEALAFLRGLAEAHAGAQADPAFQRAMRLVDPAARGATKPLISVAGEDDERLEVSPYASLVYEDDPRNSPDVNRDYRVGVGVYGSLDSSSIFVVDIYQGTASQGGRGTPDFGDLNAIVEGVDFNSYVNEAYIEFPITKMRFLFGHSWLRWGPGKEGTLALSDAAPALDMLRVEAGMFRRLRYNQFVAMLDPGPQTYLAGHRVEWRARDQLLLGVTELARFDGTSQVPLYLIPFVPYSYWEKRPKSGGVSPADTSELALHKNNVMYSVDASWIPRPGYRIYGEFMLDDISFSSDYKPDMIGYQAGFNWRRPLGSQNAAGVTVEYARVNNYTYSAWHGHDFSYNGFPTGYVLGPDVEALSSVVSYEWGAAWEFQARGELRKKGEGHVGDAWEKADGKVDASAFQGVVERETRFGGTVIYSPGRWLSAAATVGASDLENRHHVAGLTESETPITISVRLSW